MKLRNLSFLIISWFLFSQNGFSTTYYSRASTSWNTPSTWSTVACGGAAATTIPGAADNVIICSGYTIAMNGNPANCLSLTISGTADWSSGFIINVGLGGLVMNPGSSITGSGGPNSGTLNVAGNFTVNSGGTSTLQRGSMNISGTTNLFGTFAITSTFGTKTFQDININGGTFSSNAAETYTINGNVVMTNGTLTGTNTGIFNIGGTLTVAAGTSTLGAGTITVTGNTTVNGTLNENSTTGTKTFSNVIINSGATWNNLSAETYAVTGILTMNGGTITGTSTGSYNVTGGFTVATGINTLAQSLLIVTGPTNINATLNITSITGTKTFGDFNISSTGTWNSVVAEDYTINGNISDNGIFTSNTGTYTIAGTGKTISGTSTMSFNNLNNTGSYTNNGIVEVTTKHNGGGSFSQGTTGSYFSKMLSTGFTVNTFNASAAGNIVTYNYAGIQNIRTPTDGSYYHLTTAGSGIKSLIANETIGGNLLISAGTTLSPVTFNIFSKGDFTNNGTFTAGTGTVTFNGTLLQTIGGSIITSFRNATISNSAGIALALNTSVTGSLSFTAGVITTGANKVSITSTGSVTGAGTSKFVNGYLEKNVAFGAGVARTFEIGNGTTNYLPVILNFASVTTAGNITASVSNSDHPNITTSCIDELKSVNHYWTLTNSGTAFTTYSATSTFIGPPTDADAGSVTANYYMSLYSGGAWTLLTRGTVGTTTNQGTGIVALGDLQVGERRTPVITVQPSNDTVCNNTPATFSLTVNGVGLFYQWQESTSGVFSNVTNGGIYSGATTPTLTINPAVNSMNGYQYRCVISTLCVPSIVISNTVTLKVNPIIPVSVSISTATTTICAGSNTTFTATPTNGGTIPSYQWKLNGVNVGTNSATYSNAALTNGNTVTCVLTSNAACPSGNPATSNTITMTVNPNLPVSVSIAASATTICSGTNVTFTATPTNGGTTPSYQWKLNGVNVGTNSTTYSNAALANGNTVSCVLTSNAVCATGNPATSNTVTMTVNPNLPVSVSIAASATTICSGTNVTFTATPTNGGTTPAYQWKLNGVNVGSNSTTYSNSALANSDVVTCVLTSNAVCATGNPATSNTVTMTVNPNLPVSVSIAASATTICSGTNVTFTATPTNGGTIPSYQWKLNGVNVGTNSATYSNAALTNGNSVTCVLTSNAFCATGNPATSNTVTMTVNPNLPVSVSIVASATTICSGTNVTFTATPTNGGTTPSYQWKLNGVNVGLNSTTYSNAALVNSDVVTCVLTSNAVCATGNPATSNTVTMTVNPNLPVSVSIAASATTICSGTNVTFTATPTNGGTTPAYQWKLNGVNVGSNSTTYSNAALVNSDVVTCALTSNAVCATGSPATSNTITMTVNPNLPVSVSISASSSIICPGTNVTFTATPTNGGITPSYQWKLNGVNVGSNSITYSNAALANGDVVTCVLTSNATCITGNPATSNAITITVNPALPVSVSISANPSGTICSGTNVTFTAVPVNGGGAPSYQWKLNGVNVGTNSATYSNAALITGDAVVCVLSSTATCGTGSPATSNTVTMTVNPNLPVSVSIAASATTICSGTNVTFTATPTNGGATPAYQWKLNGVNVGSNSTTYSNAALANGDVVTCVLTSNAVCATGNPATSNTITMTVNPNLPVSVSIAASATTICSGTNVTFTATPTNGGTTPSYQWKLNGVNVGSNSTTYSNAALANGDVVTCVLTSNAVCATGSPATSNAITMTVNPNLPLSVSIAASATTICSGTSVIFTASAVNGGGYESYQWQLNGTNVGANSSAITLSSLSNGDNIVCVVSTTAQCVTGNPATSNTVTMTVNPNLPVNVSIAASATTICSGTNVTFTATPTNGGTTPAYQWKLNGVNVGTNSATYSNATLANGNTVTCILTSNAVCATGNPATSNTITMTVNPNLPVSVSIAASATTICSGTNVTFTATPANGGTTPAYQWKLNGLNVGSNSTTYSNAALANGDVVTCVLTSNAVCATGSPATSNTITMTVNPNLPVSVSIAASATTICSGTNVTFTATPTNGGTTPAYQWKLNGVNVGTNSATYSNATLANGNTVTCVLTSNAVCATGNPATSNTVTMTVNPNFPVSVSIAASATTICSGTNVTFTATPTNGGSTPAYQWKLNGVNVGLNSTTYSNAALVNSDVVTCVLTSNAVCATGNPATSNTVTMTVNPILSVSVAISGNPTGSVCAGTSVTFTATPTNGGTAPAYQWKLNGVNVGINSATYTSSTLSNGDVITCVLTSNIACPTGNPATSNAITQNVSVSGTWLGAVSTDWNSSSNWCGGVPLTTTNVVIPTGTLFSPALSGISNCKNITIASGVVLDLNDQTLNVFGAFAGTGTLKGSLNSSLNFAGAGAGGTFYMDQSVAGVSNNLNQLTVSRSGASVTVGSVLNVTNAIIVSAGTLAAGNNLTLISDASGTARVGTLVAGADITGNVTVQRYIPTGTDGWMFISSPVSGVTLQDWADDFITGGFPGSFYPPSPNPSIVSYNESLPGIYDDGYIPPSNITDPIAARNGYWAYIIHTPVTLDVTGPLLKNTQTFSISYTNDPSQPASENGWNLVANPYASTIDWDAAGWTKTNVNDAIYMYSPTLDQYTSYVGGIGTNGGSNLIASSQAFLVQSNAPSPVLKLTESAKDASDGLFIRATQRTSNDDLIKLNLSGSGHTDETIIHFNSGATDNFDLSYDALKFFSFNTDVPGIGSVLDTSLLSVNTFPLLTTDKIIPIKVKVGISGNYTIALDNMSRLPEGSCIILKDLLTGIETDLRSTPSVNYYIRDTTVAPRFLLKIGRPMQSFSTASTCNGNQNGMAVVTGNGAGPFGYTWSDASGNVIQTHSSAVNSDTLKNIPSGIYSVVVSGNSGVCASSVLTVNVPNTDSLSVQANVLNANCSGDANGSIDITSITGGNPPYSISWSNGINNTTDNLNLAVGTYILSVIDSVGCIQTETYSIHQNSTFSADFTTSSDTVHLSGDESVEFSTDSKVITSFIWDFGDGSPLNYTPNPSYLYSNPGTYTVKFVASDGSCTDTVIKTVVVLAGYTGINELSSNDQIKVGTNNKIIDLIFNYSTATDVNVSVFNSIGQEEFPARKVKAFKNRITFNFEDKSKGVYYIKLQSESGAVVIKKVLIF